MRETTAAAETDGAAAAARTLTRRATLGLLGGAVGAAFLGGCGGGTAGSGGSSSSSGGSSSSGSSSSSSGSSSGGSSSSSSGSSSGATGSGTCTTIPEETAGPYPADGSNTSSGTVVDALSNSGIIRSTITSDIDGSNTQTGIPLTLTIRLENSSGNCTALSGVYVYIWHCNKDGSYSEYSSTQNGGDYEGHTFLRGVQQSDSNGEVTFVTIYPGRYDPRATHIHVEVYPDSSFNRNALLSTSQFAFPDAVNTTVYESSGYTANQGKGSTDANDQVFGTSAGGDTYQLLTVTGDTGNGYVASITMAVAA